jgi:hypothetical protein
LLFTQFRLSTSMMPPIPGDADLLADEVGGAVDAALGAGDDAAARSQRVGARSGDLDQIETLLIGLEKHGRCRPADLRRIRDQRRRDDRPVLRDGEIGLEPVLGEIALVLRDENADPAIHRRVEEGEFGRRRGGRAERNAR